MIHKRTDDPPFHRGYGYRRGFGIVVRHSFSLALDQSLTPSPFLLTALLYACASVACLAAQVWLYLCESEPWCVQAAGGIAAAAVCAAAVDHLRTSLMLWTN
jgi:hypothetical protein